jgi:3,4-dihydroxy 2-butanone 4-phosphate synthase/GTP cyclohydrolase II
VDHVEATTGISAHERAATIRAVVSPLAGPLDFTRPGHVFPLVGRDGGVFARRGHTEAAIDLARLAGFRPSGVICEIMSDDGSMARLAELDRVAERHGLPMLSVEDLVRYRDAVGDVRVWPHSSSRLPSVHGELTVSTYSSEDPASGDIVLLESAGGEGQDPAEAPLVRIHSECLTGEAFSSTRCDCGPQLATALERIGREGGALVYLKQEGRGIGLVEKIRAYALQDEGMDTVEANLALGHEADGRRFGAAAAVLREAGYDRLRLLTNNPEKVRAVRDAGIEVRRREDLTVGIGRENRRYLATKIARFGHVIQGVEG